MPEKDICVLHREGRTSGSGLFASESNRFVITEFLASGKLNVIWAGEWFKYKYQAAPQTPKPDLQNWEIIQRVFSSLVADGWIRLDKQQLYPGTFGITYYRDTRVPPSEEIALPDRMKIVDGFIQSGSHESLASYLLKALEELRKTSLSSCTPSKEEMVALLERLAVLHDSGKLSDEEYEQSKRKVLGL